MFLMYMFLLSALPNALPAGSIFCPDPEAYHMTDCLGLRFTWIHSVFDNFPSMLSFVSKLHCVTGICPRDLEDYGCSCRYVAAGNPVDALDVCCEAHRLCYQNAAPCRQELPLAPYNFSCAAAANTSCDAADLCQQRFCECDRGRHRLHDSEPVQLIAERPRRHVLLSYKSNSLAKWDQIHDSCCGGRGGEWIKITDQYR
ncbi:otoconin-90-like [Simochromis diagramma]|uniref:otoconin-90-like n=1 Tax=Simochromis diagramma TaxID=43689 RepID=UPI001A7E2273|nr:otoconin-90-like [Simochromis diagramma]